ncbi:hypothetical protein PT279_01070 [Bifidobacterium sp. ESL0784]|uniref:hypothetical protein n=1 Tax=Bifidobacterium sp. ESL0784 TaxID=2983231 RepID=UPI0023F740AC|nr:hypothetical protein [Bifidobacterium sp. ESL0784]MDF7640189.1 hypothetical protein [Bifidobacterium sp. ESL0784]
MSRTIVKHTEDPDTTIIGVLGKREWNEDNLEDLLNEYASILSRGLPSVDNIQLASRDSPHTTGTIGVLQFTYTSVRKDWFANLFVFPVHGSIAILFMHCTWDNAFVRAGQFMDIAESIQLVDDEPNGKGSHDEE